MILHTDIQGTGEPLVLIHSGGMTGGTEYTEQSDYFSKKGYMVIRPDLRGHGKSTGQIENYTSHFANDLLETLESLKVEQCHIAGVSLGGQAALMYAKKHPEKVKSLTFSGSFRSNLTTGRKYYRRKQVASKPIFLVMRRLFIL
ncbi:pimeloyl-ACP methyl ester carboxylesterase [Cytobacillus purgationiresistens]|uniref:Pimeloyl-ACP methyl ester carboxylesterase n=1 Tax=Cytobacillus purgationiresistens TaxID=863449 RepID=A0ABU0AAQ5_9BACI|nr:pimeloyl-ACP methyl ester carboxylesterase [Cytobacillus purgationiresistens]